MWSLTSASRSSFTAQGNLTSYRYSYFSVKYLWCSSLNNSTFIFIYCLDISLNNLGGGSQTTPPVENEDALADSISREVRGHCVSIHREFEGVRSGGGGSVEASHRESLIIEGAEIHSDHTLSCGTGGDERSIGYSWL